MQVEKACETPAPPQMPNWKNLPARCRDGSDLPLPVAASANYASCESVLWVLVDEKDQVLMRFMERLRAHVRAFDADE